MLFSYQKTRTQLHLAGSVHSFSFQMHFFLSSYSDKKLCKNPYCAIESQNFLSQSVSCFHPTNYNSSTYLYYLLLSFSWLNSWSASIQLFIPAGWEWCLLTSRELLNSLFWQGCLLSNFGYSFLFSQSCVWDTEDSNKSHFLPASTSFWKWVIVSICYQKAK